MTNFLEDLLPYNVESWQFVASSAGVLLLSFGLIYLLVFQGLRSIFRRLDNDLALVTLNVSDYPALITFALVALKFELEHLAFAQAITSTLGLAEKFVNAGLIIVASYWLMQLFLQVFIYYFREYTKDTAAMWDDVLLPIVEAVAPILVIVVAGTLVLGSFGIDLTGIWVALGGATFVIGFAIKDILANFFSGIVLLIDTPFQFGDILQLQDGSLGMLRKIGLRVTQLYMFSDHCNIYIPNSVLQSQSITNLSRPTPYFYCSVQVNIPSECNLEEAKAIMRDVVVAHPDVLGDIDEKLAVIDKYYSTNPTDDSLVEQQRLGRLRLEAEKAVNAKMDVIDRFLNNLVEKIKHFEKGGIDTEEAAVIQNEYQRMVELFGFDVESSESLKSLVQKWNETALLDPNLLQEDQQLLAEEWERKLRFLQRQTQKLGKKLANPKQDETRLDDATQELMTWLKERFKQPRSRWQNSGIAMVGLDHDTSFIYVEFSISFYVDDVKLEDGKRAGRVKAQVYQEVMRNLKQAYPNWGRHALAAV